VFYRGNARGPKPGSKMSSTLWHVTIEQTSYLLIVARTLRGSVYNLFDEHYLDPSPFPGQVPNDFPTNERMFLLEVRYTF